MGPISKITTAALCVIFLLVAGCGPGFEGYADQYSEAEPFTGEPWDGDQIVYVVLEDAEATVELNGMETVEFQGVPAVHLSDVIIASGLTQNPEVYRYDFTATDAYNLFAKRDGDLSLLPSWTDMQNGVFYYDPSRDDLESGWFEHPWGSAVSAYRVKYMNGGTITLLEPQS